MKMLTNRICISRYTYDINTFMWVLVCVSCWRIFWVKSNYFKELWFNHGLLQNLWWQFNWSFSTFCIQKFTLKIVCAPVSVLNKACPSANAHPFIFCIISMSSCKWEIKLCGHLCIKICSTTHGISTTWVIITCWYDHNRLQS